MLCPLYLNAPLVGALSLFSFVHFQSLVAIMYPVHPNNRATSNGKSQWKLVFFFSCLSLSHWRRRFNQPLQPKEVFFPSSSCAICIKIMKSWLRFWQLPNLTLKPYWVLVFRSKMKKRGGKSVHRSHQFSNRLCRTNDWLVGGVPHIIRTTTVLFVSDHRHHHQHRLAILEGGGQKKSCLLSASFLSTYYCCSAMFVHGSLLYHLSSLTLTHSLSLSLSLSVCVRVGSLGLLLGWLMVAWCSKIRFQNIPLAQCARKIRCGIKVKRIIGKKERKETNSVSVC